VRGTDKPTRSDKTNYANISQGGPSNTGDSIWGKCIILFFSGVFESEGAIRPFFFTADIGLRITNIAPLALLAGEAQG
jgi:hypothetical protein